MLQVCFKPITWYIGMHPVKAFFLCGIVIFSYYAMFIHNMLIFKRKAYHGFFLPYNCQHGQCLSAEDKYDQEKFGVIFLKTKCPVSFPLEDKLVVNEHHVVRKSHDATEKNCHQVVHFIVP